MFKNLFKDSASNLAIRRQSAGTRGANPHGGAHQASSAARSHRSPCYSTVTDFARLRGWSTSQPRSTAMARANSCSGTLAVMALNASRTFGM